MSARDSTRRRIARAKRRARAERRAHREALEARCWRCRDARTRLGHAVAAASRALLSIDVEEWNAALDAVP